MKNTHSLTHQDAADILSVIRKALEAQAKGAAIAVSDAHGELLAFLRTDGCPLPSIQNALNKAFTSAREGIPSRQLGEASRTDPFPLTNFGDLRYTGWGGGLPLLLDGEVVGAIGVSGLPEAEDMELAKLGVDFFNINIAAR
ncbi:MAG: heme-binding protein [Bacteroidota bacterium]